MKARQIAISFFTCLCFATSLNAQTELGSRSKIQLNFGLANTFHYNAPVNLNFCIEGCFPTEQQARIGKNLEISYARSLNFKNDLLIGVGVTQYKYWEKGLASPGGPGLVPYEQVVDFGYYNIWLGHRFTPTKNKIKPFLENNIVYEFLASPSETLRFGGLALKSKLGAIANISERLDLNINGFFKSAIGKYNSGNFERGRYVPYSYGLEIGISVNI